MKILYFCQLYPPAVYGGGEYLFFQWARELVRRGHKVFTITQRLVGERNFEVVNGIHVYRVGPAIKYKGTLPLGTLENIGYVIDAAIKGITMITKNRIHVIHSNTYSPTFAGQICASIFQKPHVITVHDVYFLLEKNFWDKWASQACLGNSVGKIGSLVEKIVLKFPAAVFHSVSETSRQDLNTCGLQKVTVIYNGIDLRDFDSINTVDLVPYQAIYVGRLVFYKNLDIVIRSMKLVVSRIPDSRLIIVGDGPIRARLEKLVKDLCLTKNVVFKGRISHEEKVRLLKQSSFLVLPSLVEGFGIVLLEAFACHKPVLVSAVRPLTEIVENEKDGCFVAPFDVAMWAEKMIELFNNPRKAKKMGVYGRRKLERNYTVQKAVDKLEELYSKVVKCKQDKLL